MMMAKLWDIAKCPVALRRVLHKATGKQAAVVRDLVQSLTEAREAAGLPNITPRFSELPDERPRGLLAITDGNDVAPPTPFPSSSPMRRAASAPTLSASDRSRAPESPNVDCPTRAASFQTTSPSRSPIPRANCGSPQLAWAFARPGTRVTTTVRQTTTNKRTTTTQAIRTIRERKVVGQEDC